jgi:hypothetical protein
MKNNFFENFYTGDEHKVELIVGDDEHEARSRGINIEGRGKIIRDSNGLTVMAGARTREL